MAKRGQPGNGISKLTREIDDGLTIVQSKREPSLVRGDLLPGIPDGHLTPGPVRWMVAVVHHIGEYQYTPEAARELAAHLVAAADECEQFEREDRRFT